MTRWSNTGISGAIAQPVVGTYTTSLTPNAGELLVCSWQDATSTTPWTAATVTDTGSAGWAQIRFITQNSGGFHLSTGAWWKVATGADASGITVTLTATGGSGGATTSRFGIGVDRFAVSGRFIPGGIDLSASAASASGIFPFSFSPSVGATRPADVDELAWSALGASDTITGLIGTCTFTGTSSHPANMTTSTTGQAYVFSEFLEGAQASATAGTNVWSMNISTSIIVNVVGASFYYCSGTKRQQCSR